MLRDITLGQYYQAESIIHKLDPRVKLGGTLLFIVSLFFFENYLGYVVAALFLALVIKLSTVPFKFMVKGMKAILFLLLLTVVFNLFLTPGEALVSLWKLTITKEGVVVAVQMAIRLSFLIIGSSVMTLTTTPNHLTDGMEKLMNPLNKIKIPVHEIAMMMSLNIRSVIKICNRLFVGEFAVNPDIPPDNEWNHDRSIQAYGEKLSGTVKVKNRANQSDDI